MSKPDEFKEFRMDPFAARVYKDGRVLMGFLVYDSVGPNKTKIEVEVASTSKAARDFCEKLTGFINMMEGRY